MPMPTSIPESYILLALYKDENAKLQKKYDKLLIDTQTRLVDHEIEMQEDHKKEIQELKNSFGERIDSLEAEKRRMQTRLDELEANNTTTTTTNTAAATANENPVEANNSTTTTTNTAAATTNENPVEKVKKKKNKGKKPNHREREKRKKAKLMGAEEVNE